MAYRNTRSSPRNHLLPQQSLELVNVSLESARKTNDPELRLELCGDAEAQIKRALQMVHSPVSSGHTENKALREGITATYSSLGELQNSLGQSDKARVSYKKAGLQQGGQAQQLSPSQPNSIAHATKELAVTTTNTPATGPQLSPPRPQQGPGIDIAEIPQHIFAENLDPSVIVFKLPDTDERLTDTRQLAYCLGLLQIAHSPDDILDPNTRKWLQDTEMEDDEQERLKNLARNVIKEFKSDEIKDSAAVAEVVCLASVLDKDIFRDLLRLFYVGVDQSDLLDFHQLEGLTQMMQSASPGYLDADDLVKILNLLSRRLQDSHQQSTHHICQLTLTVSQVLDAMADTSVKGLDRKTLHEPLTSYLNGLKGSSDPYLVFQSAYAFQALLCVPDNETLWQATMRRTGKVFKGVSGLVSAVKGLDLNKFIEGLGDIQQGMAGAIEVIEFVQDTYDGAKSLVEGGKNFLDCLKEGLSFDRKRAWYSALRGADALVRDGQFAKFRRLVCEAPCRRDPAFQWGICQRLGEIATNTKWDMDTRQSAVAFLGEMYMNDEAWGQQANVKQWILNVLMQLTSLSLVISQRAESLLQELRTNGDAKKQALYQDRREEGPTSHPLSFDMLSLSTSTLLDRVQSKPDVEASLRQLRRRRIDDRGIAVYIPPQAKAGIHAPDDIRFPLMESVKAFLASNQKVFLLLGDSGSGKSTFNQELEYDLWRAYKNKDDRIPLYINLPTIDKPEQDMIAKQLRKVDFTEPQIRELKQYRRFILICDGYDESQQTRNLYMSNQLDQEEEWDAQMVISCRSESLGADYRDRFQPADRNRKSDPALFREAVITPFSEDQIQDYIKQYVSVHQPLWKTEDYQQTLDLVPSLKDLVKNPFLLTLSLAVLPRMVDPGKEISSPRVTKVALYDQFVEQWLERGKKRLGEKELSHSAREAFESLSDEGFTQNGIDYLKKLCVAIYKEQGGHPVIDYSRFGDEGSWKAAFFSRDEEKQLLREACPLTRSGNQHRFVHRSLLEYGLTRAVFDPQEHKKAPVAIESKLTRRGSMSSVWSFEVEGGLEEPTTVITEQQVVDPTSPLVWRSFVKEPSVIQFLSERVEQEPVFKEQLLDYIEHSKTDKKWRVAAANAITILVRAGVDFIDSDLQGIQIPGADLGHGMFDSAQLQDADLRRTNLRGVWMRQTNLSRAKMTGAQFGELPLLTEDAMVQSCAYSPDGRSFALGLITGQIKLYSTSTWGKPRTLSGHDRRMLDRLTFSPNGHQIASVGKDKMVRLWDVETGESQHVLKGHTLWIFGVSYSPQGDVVASAGSDGVVHLWDVATGQCSEKLFPNSAAILSVVYSPKGNQIAFSTARNTIQLWNMETGLSSLVMSGHDGAIHDVTYSPQGDRIASASEDKTIRLWDLVTGTCRRVLTGHDGSVYSVAYSPKNDQIASGGQDGTVRLWDAESGICRHTLTGHGDAVRSVAYSPGGGQLATGSYDKTVRLWDISAGASLNVSNSHSKGVLSVKCSPRGDQVASSGSDDTIRLWDVETGVCRRTLRGHLKMVFSVDYSPQGDLIASASADTSVRLWDVETGECRHDIVRNRRWVNCVAYSPRGDQIATASADNTVRLLDAKTGNCIETMIEHSEDVLCVVYSPDGNQLASGGVDHTVRLWDIATATCSRVLHGHRGGVKSVVYSPQGDQLASASEDKTIRLSYVDSGVLRLALTGHNEAVLCVAYSPKGDILASGSQDKTVRLWDVASGQHRAVIEHFQDGVYGIAWSTRSDTNYLVTGCGDSSVLMWQIIDEGDLCRVRLCWSATNGALTVAGALLRDVRGLTLLNKQLLKQRGGIDDSEQLLRKVASEGLIAVAPMVSEVEQPLWDGIELAMESSSKMDLSEDEQPEQQDVEFDPLDYFT